jgi:uncharacterized protein (TIGR02302 family)
MDKRLETKVWLARASLWWETLWNAALPALLVIALFAIAVLTGALASLADIARYIVLALFAAAFIWSLKSFWRLKTPGQADALRRIEVESGLSHRPVSAAYDQLADPAPSQTSQQIWQAHKMRQLAQLKNLKTGLPRSSWLKLDQKALRVPVGLALLAAIFLHRGDPVSSLADAVRVAPSATAATLALDAWIKPPAYTGKPPIMLTSPATIERLAREGEVIVPESSGLVIRLANATDPQVHFYELTDGPGTGAELKDVSFKSANGASGFQGETKLLRPAHVKVFDGSSEIASWRVSILPDAAPKVSFDGDPRGEAGGSLAVKWKAFDDYGVAGIKSEINLSDTQDGQVGIAGNGVFLFDPPQFPISLKKASPREAKDTSAADLTAHPWAGLIVDMQLEASDAAGKTGKSEIKTFKLPERDFFKPLARALIEQRKALVMNPDETEPVERMLEALLAYPEGLVEESGQHIAIRTVHSMISHASGHDDIKGAVDLLWKIAVAIEDGDTADAKRQLDQVRKELEKALAEGASPERIKELMEKLREAMNKYLESMQAEAQKRLQQQDNRNENMRRQQGQMIKPEDLQKMLDQIENLSKNGANEAAQEMLAQLDQILRNLQAGIPQQMGEQGNSEMSQMLDELSELMRRQQQLMDDTQRLPEDGQGQQGEQQGEQGEQGPSGRGQQPNPGDLSAQQEALGRMLQEMMERLGQQGMQAPQSFGKAGKSMEGAAEALRQGQRGQALGQEGEALNQLREGAQNMARQMMQQGMGNQGNYGRTGESRGDDRDPLGRPLPTQGEDYGPDRNIIPGEAAMRRAREILEMLRSRSNTPDLPRIERDYLERLLRGLY